MTARVADPDGDTPLFVDTSHLAVGDPGGIDIDAMMAAIECGACFGGGSDW